MIQIAPSILSADFASLGNDIRRIEQAGADIVHIDVMDGVFVPNLSIGLPVVKCVRPVSALPFDVHLMIIHPKKYVPQFCKAGADIISFHAEAQDDPLETINAIVAGGAKPAMVIKPGTPAEAVFPYLDKLYMVLVMTVEPGFGGQAFMADMLPKIAALRAEIDRRGLCVDIQVDGGINAATAQQAAKAGATVAVVGNALFTSSDAPALVRQMQAL